MILPLNCPKPCWYAYMQWRRGSFKERLPDHFLEFVRFVRERAQGRAVLGWGMSRGAKWLTELVREHAGLLDAAVMFGGYPQTRDQYDQVANAQELIAIRDCFIVMVHFAEDECCGVSRFPFWHGEFTRHMADQDRMSSLISMQLPGNHAAATPLWLDWKMEAHPLFGQLFESMWQRLAIKR